MSAKVSDCFGDYKTEQSAVPEQGLGHVRVISSLNEAAASKFTMALFDTSH